MTSHHTNCRIRCNRPAYIPKKMTDSTIQALRIARLESDSEYGEASIEVYDADADSVEINVGQWCDTPGDWLVLAHLSMDLGAARLLADSIYHVLRAIEETNKQAKP